MELLIQKNKILTQELAKKTETIIELQNSLEIVRAQCSSLNDQITLLKGGSNQEENCEVVDSATVTSLNNTNLRESKKEEICCPLCCKESFATKEDLKVHLSKIIEDTFCSICSLKCDRLPFIKKHVDNGCNINSNIEDFLNYKSAVEDRNDEIIKTMALISFKMPGVEFNIDRNSFNGIRIIEDNGEEVKNELIEENHNINSLDKSYTNWLIEKQRDLRRDFSIKAGKKSDSHADDPDWNWSDRDNKKCKLSKINPKKNSAEAKVRKHNVKPLPLDKKSDFAENNTDKTDLDLSYEEPRNINHSKLHVRKESNLNTSDTSNDELNSDGVFSWSDDESSSDENSSSSELNYSSHENSYHSDVKLRKNKKSSKSPNNDDKEYFCSACNMSFKNLINHIKEHHVGESVKVEGGIEELEKKLKSHENLKKKPTKPSTPSNCAMPQNKTNFWVKRDCVFNFVGDEKKMISLYPKFIPSENVVKPLTKNQSASTKLFTYLKKIVCIKYFGDSWLIDGNIFVTNKKIDRATLGPLAKIVSSSNDTETNESDDELDVFKGANRKEINMYIICANIDDEEEMSIENVDFYALPPVPKKVIPFLSNVTNPPIPLLKGSKQLKFQCNNCGSSVPPSVDGYNHHTCYKCKYCGKNFKKKMHFFMNHLKECVKLKASVPLPSFACSSCPSRFNSNEEVQDHTLLHYHHSDAAQCGICYCHFKRKTILCEHLKSEHRLEDSQMESAIRNPIMCENNRNKDIKTPLNHEMHETSKSIENQDKITIPVNKFKKEEATKEILNLTLTRSNRKRKVNSSFSEYIYY